MALVINDRVKVTSTTTGGTGAFAFRCSSKLALKTFTAGIGNSNTTYYTIFESRDYRTGKLVLGTVTDGTECKFD
jgi:hypothetical protein